MLLHRFASFVANVTAEFLSAITLPAGPARAEDTGLSKAREAAEAVPAESVRLE
ncbi:hypothetical protein [Planococcus shixiaomingii]|uniref:hypothetical protein n=1 Tax=Planococcus shixiaomingii TaxID=3058393 RepID=UPI0026596E04|nr:hypothetical protein [Planococcus sp. N028]